jgi:hypothetical protein
MDSTRSGRDIYPYGWVASTIPPAPPWLMGGFRQPQDAANGYKWELSNSNEDDSQNIDLVAKRPNKLRQMQEIFTMEATRDNMLPLDNTVLPRLKRPRLVLAEDQALPGIGMFVAGSRRDVQRTGWGALAVLPSSEGPS